MKNWNWKRVGCLVGGVGVLAVGFVFPPAKVVTLPLGSKLLIAGGISAGWLVGVATKTPGQSPQ